MAKILITGSEGVVGTWLTKILREQKHTVFGLDLIHLPNSQNYARCDIGQFRQLERFFQDFGPFDFVYHTAAEFGRWNGEDYYEQLWQTNVIGTKHLLRLQEKLGFTLIHFSSSEVYGDYPELMSEEVMRFVEVKQLNDYAMTKWVNEMQIGNSRKQFHTQTVIVRLFNTYGPGEWFHSYRSVNARFCYSALHGLPITVYRGHTRTSAYLEDTCRTLANIVKNFIDGEVYNLGGREEHSMEDLAKLIWDLTGANPKLIKYQNSEPLTTKSKKVDISKAVRELDHQITTNLSQGIQKTLTWMREYYGLPTPKKLLKSKLTK